MSHLSEGSDRSGGEREGDRAFSLSRLSDPTQHAAHPQPFPLLGQAAAQAAGVPRRYAARADPAHHSSVRAQRPGRLSAAWRQGQFHILSAGATVLEVVRFIMTNLGPLLKSGPVKTGPVAPDLILYIRYMYIIVGIVLVQ